MICALLHMDRDRGSVERLLLSHAGRERTAQISTRGQWLPAGYLMTLSGTGPPAACKDGLWALRWWSSQPHVRLSCTMGWQQPPGLQLCLLLTPSHVFKLDLLVMLNKRLQIPCTGRSSQQASANCTHTCKHPHRLPLTYWCCTSKSPCAENRQQK